MLGCEDKRANKNGEKKKKTGMVNTGQSMKKISSKYDNNIVTSANDAAKRARYAKK